MSLSRRGSSWLVSLTHEGKRYRRQFPTRHQAELAEAEGRARLLRGEDPWLSSPKNGATSVPRTVRDLANLTYRSRWQGTKGERTALTNGAEIVKLLGPDRPIRQVDQVIVNEVHRKLRARLSPATVNRKLAALSAMLTVAVEEGLIPSKPRVPREKEPPGRLRYLTPQEEQELFLAMDDGVMVGLFSFLLDTGLRLGEALVLTKRDVDEGAALVTVRDSKAGTCRSLPLTPRALAEWHCNGPWNALTPGQVTYAWNKAKAKTSMREDPEVVPHCLRHTCASRLVQSGVDLLTVQRWLGHATLAMTMKYSHLAPDSMVKARDTLQAFHVQPDRGEAPPDDSGAQ